MAAGVADAQSGATFTQGETQTQNKRVSPNGKYLVGESTKSNSWGLDAVTGYESFVKDLETGEATWLTSFDTSDLTNNGSFTDVNDEGVICGVIKDEDYKITVTEMGATYELPLNVAAVWKDGERKSLGLGTFSTEDFTTFSDGSFAIAVSNDSKTVAGYVASGNYARVYPCLWTLDEATGEYEFRQYAVPEGCTEARIYDVSGDGSKAVGYVKLPDKKWCTYACYWPSPDEYVIIDDPNPIGGTQSNGIAYAISNNGEYVGLTNNGYEPALYIVNSRVLKTFGYGQGILGCEIGGVTDSGDLMGVQRTNYGSNPFWYSNSGMVKTDFEYFVYLYADDIDIPYGFNSHAGESVSFSGVSADGGVIAGNDTYGKPWVLTTTPTWVSIPPTVQDFNLNATALGEITVTFPRSNQETYVWYKAKEYVIYRDGVEAGRVSVEELDAAGTDEVVFADKNVGGGSHYYSIAVNFVDNNTGEELLSPKSVEKTVFMESSFAFPLYDNFDTNSIASEEWSVQRDYGDTSTQFWGCGQYFGLNGSSYLNVGVAQSQPYSFSLVSRHMDATDKESVYISFARQWMWANSDEWELDKDTLSVEVSTDGATWTAAKDLALCDMDVWSWSFEYIDLTPWAAGKTFQVRLRVHGQAAAQYVFYMDNLTVDEKPQHEGTRGAMGMVDGDSNFRLTWKNSLGAYSLNYLGNILSNVEGRTLGNEGRPLIAANKFDAEDLGMYKGKYLTSVTTQINRYETETPQDIPAAIVIFEDGRLVREQEFIPAEYNTDITVKLDEPMAIDGTKELMIGIKVYDYPEDQMPILYHKTSSFVNGKSNLYSEDGGTTWLNLADFYADAPDLDSQAEGFASWVITGNVTDEAEVEEKQVDTNQYAYEVYKNGEKYSQLLTHFLQGWFTDENSVEGDVYEVRTFFYDGTVSELSAPVRNEGTTVGVDGVEAAGGNYTVEDGKLTVGDGNSRVEIYNAEGVKVYEGAGSGVSLGSFGHGMFILKVYGDDGTTATHKIAF